MIFHPDHEPFTLKRFNYAVRKISNNDVNKIKEGKRSAVELQPKVELKAENDPPFYLPQFGKLYLRSAHTPCCFF